MGRRGPKPRPDAAVILIATKVSRDVAATIRQRARSSGQTTGGFVRDLVIAALGRLHG